MKYSKAIRALLSVSLLIYIAGGMGCFQEKDSSNPQVEFRSSEGYDKTRWGMRMAKVQRLYPQLECYKSDQMCELQTSFARRPGTLFYYFTEDILFKAGIMFEQKFIEDDYYYHFNVLRDLLKTKYGIPTIDTEDENTENDPPHLRPSIKHITGWFTGKTTIELRYEMLVGDWMLTIGYTSNELQEILKQNNLEDI